LLEKNIGPLTEAMYHDGSFSWTNPQSLMRKLLAIKKIRGVHLSVARVIPVWMSQVEDALKMRNQKQCIS
jgi:hypothetical protein